MNLRSHGCLSPPVKLCFWCCYSHLAGLLLGRRADRESACRVMGGTLLQLRLPVTV